MDFVFSILPALSQFITYMSMDNNWIQRAFLLALILSLAGTPRPASGSDAALGHPVQMAVAALDNRFVATGVILDSKRTSTGMHVFKMKIEKVGQVQGFADLGAEYQGLEKEFFSEIGAPPALTVGKRVSVILRVSGDEWRQILFLVEVIDNGSRN